jgi:hypothetical protein
VSHFKLVPACCFVHTPKSVSDLGALAKQKYIQLELNVGSIPGMDSILKNPLTIRINNTPDCIDNTGWYSREQESVSGLHSDLFSPHGPHDKGGSYSILAHDRDHLVINAGQ